MSAEDTSAIEASALMLLLPIRPTAHTTDECARIVDERHIYHSIARTKVNDLPRRPLIR